MGKYKLNDELTKSGRYKRKKLEKRRKLDQEIQNGGLLQNVSNSSYEIDNINENEDEQNSSVITLNRDFHLQNDLRTDLANWSIKNKVSGVAVTSLLKILREHNISSLPLDSRTLKNTPRVINIETLSSGQYIHIGLETNLNHIFKSYHSLPNTLLLNINVDGAPIYDDSYEYGSLWPILCHISNLKSPVFAIAIYGGASKPSDFNEFLRPFVEEFLNIRDNLTFKDSKIRLKIENIILDAPARSSVCGIKSHNAYSGCPKCHDFGIKKPNGRPALIDTEAALRTNTEFRNKSDKFHHNHNSIFELIPDLDMVCDFPIDYLHNVLLGAMRKLLDLWFGHKGGLYPPSIKTRISNKIKDLSLHEPKEFNRRLRSLDKMGIWKGTELRTFLLFIGQIALKNEISVQHYENFMLLSIAINILVDKNNCIKFNEIAKILLVNYLESYENLYGLVNVTFNTHLLIHLPNECLKKGPLDQFSSFKFESFLGQIKGLVNSPNNPLEQIHNRVHELFHSSFHTNIRLESNLNIELKCQVENNLYKNAIINNVVIIGSSHDDSYVQLKNNKIVKVNEFCVKDTKIFANILIFSNLTDFYQLPIKSREIDFFVIDVNSYSKEEIAISLFKRKMFALPLNSNNKLLLCPMMPFLH